MTAFTARPRKKFGQHWLRSEPILNQIVAAAQLTPEDRVLEIGPGTGLLTQRLLPQVQHLVAVEVDRDLCRRLRQHYGQNPQFQLIEADFLTLDAAALGEPWDQRPNKVVANIPYYITGPILERLLGTIAAPQPQPYESIVLLVQAEVADRLCASPGTKACGALTVRVQYLADCEIICPVPPQAFHPPPKVASAVVRLRPRPPAVPATDPALLARLVTLGFANKRKMLRNNLGGWLGRDRLLALLNQLGLPETIRAEGLGLGDWVALSNELHQQILAGNGLGELPGEGVVLGEPSGEVLNGEVLNSEMLEETRPPVGHSPA